MSGDLIVETQIPTQTPEPPDTQGPLKPGSPELTPEAAAAKENRIANLVSGLAPGRVLEQEDSTKTTILGEMRKGFEAAKKGDPDDAGAIKRNIDALTSRPKEGKGL